MKIYQVAEGEKCGGCNWEVGILFFAADTQGQADEMYQENDRGLCASCLIDVLYEGHYEIFQSKENPRYYCTFCYVEWEGSVPEEYCPACGHHCAELELGRSSGTIPGRGIKEKPGA